MSNISTVLRPKMLIRVDSYGKLVEGVKNIYLTEEEATYISKSWETSVHAHWYERNTGNVKMILSRNDWRMENSQAKTDSKIRKWICDFGTRHHMHEQHCICDHHYLWPEQGIGIAFNFLEWCRKRFPNASPGYTSDITDRMREIFLQEKSLVLNKK
jgi:hypothetical protein